MYVPSPEAERDFQHILFHGILADPMPRRIPYTLTYPEPWLIWRRLHTADVGAALRPHAARALLPRHDREPPDQLPRLHEELRRHAGGACASGQSLKMRLNV